VNKSFLRGAGRHRKTGWRSPSVAVKFARLLRARKLSARDFPYRPARQIALEARRRESLRLGDGPRV
jgi:hypothetical protein